MKVWVLIDRDDYPFAAFDSRVAAEARANEIATQRRNRGGEDFFTDAAPEWRRQGFFAPSICELEVNAAGEPER